jgi:hypothetical protein
VNTSIDAVRDAWTQLIKLLPDWSKLELRRREREGEIASRERFLLELDSLRSLDSPEPWVRERVKLLEGGADFDKERLADLREEQRRHEETTAKLAEPVRTLCRFAQRAGIDADPLRCLYDLRELEMYREAWLMLEQIGDALATVGEQPSAEAAKEHPNIEQHMERVAQAVGDDNAARVLAIANRKDWPGERKMEEIIRLDTRFTEKDSNWWARLLEVSPAAVRGYELWKTLQRNKKARD